MKTLFSLSRTLVAGVLATLSMAYADVPQIISYQGKISVSGAAFNGTGSFKFALVNATGSTTYWSNDGTSTAGSQPAAAVSLTVTNGLYSVLLGDATLANMTVVPASVFTNSDVRLRVWFNDGTHGFTALAPDQRIAAVGYAIMAGNVQDGAITSAKIANGAVGSAQIANGAVGASQIADGAVGAAQIATGAVGAGQIANGSITAAQMADATITPSKLAKPMRSGSVLSSSLNLDFFGGSFTVPFSPAFGTAPNVTLTMDASAGSAASSARLLLTGRSPTQFTGVVSGGEVGAMATPVSSILDGITSKSSTDVGEHACVKPIEGYPAICYYDSTNKDLKFIRATNVDGTAWGNPITVDSHGDVGQFARMEAVNDFAAIVYYDATNADLKYVRATNSEATLWGAPITLDSGGNVGVQPSIAIVGGNPAVSYADGTNGRLKYVRANDVTGSSWGTPVVVDDPANPVGEFSCLHVVSGNPAICHWDRVGGSLRYVRASNSTGSAWGTPMVVDTNFDAGQYTSMTTINGNPAIAYHDPNRANLFYVRANDATGTTWGTPVQPDAEVAALGTYVCLIECNGSPAISYAHDTKDDLRFIRATDSNGATWGAPVTVDSDNDVGKYSSLTVINGKPAIAYLAVGSLGAKSVRYVLATDGTGASWSTPLTVDGLGAAGSHPCMATVAGFPAISYYDQTNGSLKFMRATNASGTAWGTPVTIDANADAGQDSSLTLIGGFPAISYFDSVNGDLKYVRAANEEGSAWGAPVTVIATSTRGRYSSLQMVNGNPAISYLFGGSGDLEYVRALDATGATWGTPVMIDDGVSHGYPIEWANSGHATGLVIANGMPAICFYDTYGHIKYVRALDVNGANWGGVRLVDVVSQDAEVFTSMKIVNGNPAIAYTTGGNSVRYARANDANGDVWGAIVTIDNAASSCSMAVIDGKPVITYGGGSFKCAQAVDPNGAQWVSTVLDSASSAGYWSSVVSMNGRIGAAYYESAGRDLKVVRAGSVTPFTILWMAQEP